MAKHKPSKEELEYHYCVLGKKQKEIAKIFGYRDISKLLDEYGIPKRKRGFYNLLTTEEVVERYKSRREDKGEFYDYSQVKYVNQYTKVKIICPLHGEFYQYPADHWRGYNGCSQCKVIKTRKTCLEKYGADCAFKSEIIKKKIRATCLEKYGVENPSQSPEIHQKKIDTTLKNYGCENPMRSQEVKDKILKNNLERYGVSCAMKIPEIAQKSVGTRIKNGTLGIAETSIEARDYIRNYIESKGYKLTQCAFSDEDNGLHEWGYHYKGRWILYDLVVFEEGYRGNKDKVLEILEYHGPFHYTIDDVNQRGEEKATPWAKSKITIRESYEKDCMKEEFGKSLTDNYTVVWSEKYHNKEVQQ